VVTVKKKRIDRRVLMVVIFAVFELILGAGGIQDARADIPTAERNALIDLYNSTDGDNWINITNWLATLGTEGTWYGLIVASDHVTDIYLSNNNLSGFIPTSLGNLTNLQSISLHQNQLTGSIPAELGNLTNLVEIYLNLNQIVNNALFVRLSSSQVNADSRIRRLYLSRFGARKL